VSKKTAVLVQAHNNVNYILTLAKVNPEVDFFVHIDKKIIFTVSKAIQTEENIYFVPDNERIDVYWGDFSQVEVTLYLMNMANRFKKYDYFHLMSGECVPLKKFIEIEREWSECDLNYMECRISKKTEWRMKTKVYHTQKKWMRKLRGKILNRTYMIIGKYFNFSEFNNNEIYFGSQWFSITKKVVLNILRLESESYFEKFRNTSCPDEHAFQMAAKLCEINMENENRRFIKFEKFSSSPTYLNKESIENLSEEYWFVRKVNENNAIDYINEKWGD